MLDEGVRATIDDLARAKGLAPSYVSGILRLIPGAGFTDSNVSCGDRPGLNLCSRSRGSVMTIAITRTGLDAAGFRRAAAREKDAAASRRMLALALVLEGRTRTEAAQAAGMDRQTLRDWVHRYNEAGLAGLTNRAGARGRRRKLTAAQEATFAAWVREGPKPDVHKVVRWRCRDLQGEIARHFGVEMHERTVGKLLARLNFSRVSVRPRHPEQDIAAQEAHKKNCLSRSLSH